MKIVGEAASAVLTANGAADAPRPNPSLRPRTTAPATSPPPSQSSPRRQHQPEPQGQPQPGEPFGNLTRLTMAVLGTPAAFTAVLDDDPVFGANQAAIGDPEEQRDFAQRSYCRKVIDSGRELLIEDARLDPDPDPDCFTEADGMVAWAGVPLRDPDGRIVGALCVADRRPRQWTGLEIGLLRDLADAAAGEFALHKALGSARKHGAERALLARTLQESLLPPWLPQIPGLEVAARYVAGGGEVDVLGDFYDVFPSVRGGWGVVVGDVCGKGVPAAKSTALARYTLRAEAHRETRPSAVLTALNRALLDWPTDDPRFLTAIYATVRPTPGGATVQIASAGHPLALVRRANGRVQEIGRAGSLLGLFPHPRLSDSRAKLRPGDSLILFTDGVTEARRIGRPGLFGDDRLRNTLAACAGRSAAQIADSVQQAARDFADAPAADDTVVLVIQAPVRRADDVGEDTAADGHTGDDDTRSADLTPSAWSPRDRAHVTIPAAALVSRSDAAAGRGRNQGAKPDPA
jgi:phosphoserine phosphatase RsbU/P